MCDIYLKEAKELKQIKTQIYRARSRANKNDLQAFTAVARIRAMPFSTQAFYFRFTLIVLAIGFLTAFSFTFSLFMICATLLAVCLHWPNARAAKESINACSLSLPLSSYSVTPRSL